jgi:hypothetical protein
MPYSIDRYNGTTLTVVEDGTIDSTLDIKLIGKNYAGYGEVQNENFLHLLENFSSSSAPPRPISGQVWFDSGTNKLKFYDGLKFRTTGGAEVGSSAPSGLTVGDFWFNPTSKQLFAWDGAEFVLIGPQSVAGLGLTQMTSETLLDTIGGQHAVIKAYVDDSVVFMISSDEFTIDSGVNPVLGFSEIKKGLTLINTGSNGVTSSTHRLWGTASNALKTNQLEVDGNFRIATVAATALTVAARDGAGDIFANVFQGVASSAKYADLAENYLPDAEYAVGTVMMVGGEKEITASAWGKRAIGVISENPAYLMNKDLEGGVAVALKGRVPVKVVGAVRKGDNLIAANDGCASAGVHHSSDVFAIALESSNDTGVKLVEAIIL